MYKPKNFNKKKGLFWFLFTIFALVMNLKPIDMKQLTKEQAILFSDSQVWVEWSNEEIVKLQLFQDKLCVPFDRFHEAITKVLDRPVFTHEFTTSNIENLVKEFLGEKPKPTFEEVVNLIPKEKRLLLKI